MLFARLIAGLTLGLCLVGCSTGAARMGLFTAEADVYAIVASDFFVGKAIGYMDRTGTINLTSAKDPSVRCVGQFEYTGSKIGVGRVNCNDGSQSDFQFNALSALSGYGIGDSSKGPMSFTFGLPLEKAVPYLSVPKGKKIEGDSKSGARMIDI